MIIFTNPIFAFLALLALTNATPLTSCTSPHNPIILLHGMSSNASSLSALSSHLTSHNYCVYALTYGAKPSSPSIGGLLPIAQSSAQIASFIHDVHAKTRAHKIDLIGHSEGAFQALFTAKFGNVSHLLEHIIATAPATHGTNLNGVYDRAYVMGEVSREILGVMLQLTGNPVLDELGPDGPAVKKLNEGPITQKGNKVTVIASKTDGVVTPPVMSFVREEGVANVFVQDYCPESRVSHEEEGVDENVWNLILNSLQNRVGRKFRCNDKY